MILRPPTVAELPALSELCLRSKAHWGYDQPFLDQCRDELTLTEADLDGTHLAVAVMDDRPVGVVQVAIKAGDADILKLFVAPGYMGRSVGTALFRWGATRAGGEGASRILIDADPGAEPFYLKLGARRVGQSASGSVPGRMLPRLEFVLASAETGA